MVPHLTGDLAAGADQGVAVGDEREVDGVEETVVEDLGEVGGTAQLVVQCHVHLGRTEPAAAGDASSTRTAAAESARVPLRTAIGWGSITLALDAEEVAAVK
jgi:hypothetical protein